MEQRTAALVEQCRRYRECPLTARVTMPLSVLETIQHTLAAQGEEIEALRRERDHYQREARPVLLGGVDTWPDGGHAPTGELFPLGVTQ